MFHKRHKNRILFLAALVCLGIGGYFYLKPRDSIKSYTNSPADRGFIEQFFKKNWEWLIPPESDFSLEHFLTYQASDKEPQNLHDTTIKVYWHNGQPVGFTAYRKTKFYEGFVNFLGVEESMRRHGFARKLLQYAIDDLTRQGCTKIWLLTRVVNFRAQKLYESMGFKEYERTDYAVYYRKYVEPKS